MCRCRWETKLMEFSYCAEKNGQKKRNLQKCVNDHWTCHPSQAVIIASHLTSLTVSKTEKEHKIEFTCVIEIYFSSQELS